MQFKNFNLPPDWEFFPGFDSPGNDIINVKEKDISALIKKSIELGAVAFNSNGWIKRKITAKRNWFKWTNNKEEISFIFYFQKGIYVMKSALGVKKRKNKLKTVNKY